MKKRFLLLLCTLSLLLCTFAQAETVDAASALLERTRSYDERFSDVSGDAWYHDAVAALYEYGLTEGTGGGAYSPDASLTVAELAVFSARFTALSRGDTIPAPAAEETWYDPYVRYLKDCGLLTDDFDGRFADVATRAQMAGILSPALSEETCDHRNAEAVTVGYASRLYITDVDDYTPYQSEILRLYKQGIVGGVDESGRFCPNEPLKRSEIAALILRMADPGARLTLAWSTLPYRSAEGTTWGSIVSADEAVSSVPDPGDADAIDALVRRTLADGASSLTLQYERALTADETASLTRAFTTSVKRCCEQMYNSVTCRSYASGRVQLQFGSTTCGDAQLAEYRAKTLARAILIHDALWESGYLTRDMSEYELARAYYVWLCNNCTYDSNAASDSSLSHLAYSALLDGYAVCDGYTGAYNLLLKLEGIECTSLMNDAHIWTVAVLDGTSYHIDVTWGDRGARVDMSCFGMTEEQSRAKHAW